MRQAIDQVEIDTLDARLAEGLHRQDGMFLVLNPVDCLLHQWIERLHAQAGTPDARNAESFSPRLAERSRVDLGRHFGRVNEVEDATQEFTQCHELVGFDDGWRPAAEMHSLNAQRCSRDFAN